MTLEDIVVGKHTGRQSPEDITLFCTAGLSGTEVAVASEALRRAGYSEGLRSGSSTANDGVGACRSAIDPAPCTAVPTSYKTGHAPSRLDPRAREGGNDASDDDPHR